MIRRDFLRLSGAATLGLLTPTMNAENQPQPRSSQSEPPLWKGFNLLNFFSAQRPASAFPEQDFEIVAEWGFNFVRIPMSYWHWSRPDPARWLEIDERPFRFIDEAFVFGKRYGLHINLNLHRIPGYCINGREEEPRDLFEGPAEHREQALAAACHHWRYLARRYKGIPNTRLSFDLVNEPPSIDPAAYAAVAKALVAAIREEDPGRLIVSDGIDVGRTPVRELADLGLIQSGRGYDPVRVSHFRAPWMPSEMKPGLPLPTWPLRMEDGTVWNKETLRAQSIAPWKAIEAAGVKVHIGEWGCYNQTPHTVALAWMKDLLDLWNEAHWGWALWNLRGDFGVLDSGRADVSYESFKGHKLDRKMLELLRA